MKEAILEKKCIDYAEKLGYTNFKVTAPGYPDRQFMKNGEVFFVEFKCKKGRLSDLQKFTINKLIKEKFKVYIINDFKLFKAIFV